MMLPAAALAGYTLWLLSVPMEGALLAGIGGDTALLYFLGPHVAALLATSFSPKAAFERWSGATGLLAVVLTTVFPLWPDHSAALLLGAGLLSGPVAVRAGLILSRAADPRAQAVWALVAANLLLAGLGSLPLPGPVKFTIVAAALSVPCLLRPRSAAVDADRPGGQRGGGLMRYLPFVFLFHLVSGLFYGSVVPAFEKARLLPAAELLFYVGAVLLGLKPMRERPNAALTLAILLSMVSLGLFKGNTVLSVHLSMFAMQGAAGFMDVFVLFFLLRQENPIRAFALGFATLCLGIVAGKAVALAVAGASGIVAVAGSMALNLALLSLYWSLRREMHGTQVHGASPGPEPQEAAYRMPPGLNARLSAMERSVLAIVLEGGTFKEAAAALAVSESSVKTYMKRIYEKAGVQGKGALLEKLAHSAPEAPAVPSKEPLSHGRNLVA